MKLDVQSLNKQINRYDIHVNSYYLIGILQHQIKRRVAAHLPKIGIAVICNRKSAV